MMNRRIAVWAIGLWALSLVPLSATQFAADWRPFRDGTILGLHGDYQLFGVGNEGGRLHLLNTLTFEAELRMTDTFRFHARFRPIKNNTLFAREEAVNSLDRTALNLDRLERAFLEVQIARIDFAVGRVPLLFHNLYLADDDVLGLLFAKNNIRFGSMPNLRLLAFATASGKDRSELEGRADREVGLYGLDGVLDTHLYTFEGTFGYLHDSEDATKIERHGGLSVTWFEQRRVTSLRLLINRIEGQTGRLGIVEYTHTFPARVLDRPSLYLNAFYGMQDYRSMANGSIKNLGIAFNQLTGAIQLPNTGIDAFGFAAGILLGKSRDFTITPEIAAVLGNDDLSRDQWTLSLRTQMRIADTSFLRLDAVALHQDDPANRNAHSLSAQAVYKF
jgi:hypothetical protein